MPFLKNIIFALCLTINLGNENHKIYIKPSTYLMPEEIFTNQANLEITRKNKIMRIHPPCIKVFSNETRAISKKHFQVNLLLPDVLNHLNFTKTTFNESKCNLQVRQPQDQAWFCQSDKAFY